MRLASQFGIAALMVASAAGGWYWLQHGEPASAEPPPPRRSATVVETAYSRRGEIQETVTAVGTTRAAQSVKIVPTTAGLITRIAFEAGQRVQAGAVLVELDSASERAGVREAESELTNLRAQMARAEALRARKLLSEADLDELRGKLGMAEARLEAVRSQRDKRIIRAPFGGVVGLRNVNLGAYVDTSAVLTTLDDLNPVELEFKVPERYFSAVKAGQTVSAVSAAFPNRRFAGAVRAVDTRIEPSARAFRVRAELPNPDALLPEGLFMSVSLVVAERRDAVLVPEEAVIREGGESYVYVVASGAAVRTPIAVGQRRDAAVEALTGLAADVEVVVKGHQSLRDKAPVRAAAQNPPAVTPGDGARRQAS
ncbi:MAG TPA: efflux RND transporter periplasmic adaptor subunit [Candidatus Competibacter sp.]|nr:efflux RND transporter periplasmic adaptor subunit [Candidatus Competibacter sp.]